MTDDDDGSAIYDLIYGGGKRDAKRGEDVTDEAVVQTRTEKRHNLTVQVRTASGRTAELIGCVEDQAVKYAAVDIKAIQERRTIDTLLREIYRAGERVSHIDVTWTEQEYVRFVQPGESAE